MLDVLRSRPILLDVIVMGIDAIITTGPLLLPQLVPQDDPQDEPHAELTGPKALRRRYP